MGGLLITGCLLEPLTISKARKAVCWKYMFSGFVQHACGIHNLLAALCHAVSSMADACGDLSCRCSGTICLCLWYFCICLYAASHVLEALVTTHLIPRYCVDVEKLEAEFGERLLRLGPKATASTLAALLAETVSGSATMAHPSSAARTAHVLIIAALNLVRVEVAPLPRPHDLPPLAFLLAQQQVRYKAIALR